jgi:drug/metabolite transporter (DMT)-like permease
MDRHFWVAAVLVSFGSLFLSLKSLGQKLVAVSESDTSVFGTICACAAVELFCSISTSLVSHVIRKCLKEEARCDCQPIRDISWRSWIWLLTRSFSGAVCQVLEFLSLKLLPLGTVTMIIYASPLFIILWSAVLPCERIRCGVILCMLMCVGGLSLIVEPWNFDKGADPKGYLICFGCPVLIGLVYVALRQLKPVHHRIVINSYMSTEITLALIVGYALNQLQIPIHDPTVVTSLVLAGFFHYLAEICMTTGFAAAAEYTSQVAVLKFLAPIFAQVWGALFLEERPTLLHVTGVAVVIFSAATGLIMRSTIPESKGFPSVATSVHGLLDESVQYSTIQASVAHFQSQRVSSFIFGTQRLSEVADLSGASVSTSQLCHTDSHQKNEAPEMP